MRSSSVRQRASVAETDLALVAAAADGDSDAFAELYRRHAPAAWGVAQSVVRNREDAADAVAEAVTKVFRALPAASARSQCLPFRAYLMRATHHAAIDVLRRTSRTEVTAGVSDQEGQSDRSGAAAPRGPAEDFLAGEDRDLIAHSFAQLPLRWRTALWLIEVERMSTREAGLVLGVSPNNAAQLATRARRRLREHYLQAHVPASKRPGCQESVDSMGGYLAGTDTRRQRSRVNDHLSACADCRGRIAEVEDLGVALRGLLLPLPLLLSERVRRVWASLPHHNVTALLDVPPATQSLLDAGLAQSSSSLARSADGVATLIQRLSGASPVLERLVVGTSVGVLAVGASALVLSGPRTAPEEARGPVGVTAAPFATPAGTDGSVPGGGGTTGDRRAPARPDELAPPDATLGAFRSVQTPPLNGPAGPSNGPAGPLVLPDLVRTAAPPDGSGIRLGDTVTAATPVTAPLAITGASSPPASPGGLPTRSAIEVALPPASPGAAPTTVTPVPTLRSPESGQLPAPSLLASPVLARPVEAVVTALSVQAPVAAVTGPLAGVVPAVLPLAGSVLAVPVVLPAIAAVPPVAGLPVAGLPVAGLVAPATQATPPAAANGSNLLPTTLLSPGSGKLPLGVM